MRVATEKVAEPRPEKAGLQQPEVDFDLCLHRDGFSVLLAGDELPFLDGLDGFLVQAQTERTDDPDVARKTLLIHLDIK
jgi:hypothetical protein